MKSTVFARMEQERTLFGDVAAGLRVREWKSAAFAERILVQFTGVVIAVPAGAVAIDARGQEIVPVERRSK